METGQTQFSPENLQKIRMLLEKEQITFFFYPSPDLRTLTSKGEHPSVKLFPDIIVKGILLGNTIELNKLIILQFLSNSLEEPWKFMLSRGEIRVRQHEGEFKFEAEEDKK